MQFELTASMMCANYGNLAQEVKALEEGGIDSFHIDIMDGRYVPNFAMSLNDMRYIAGAATKPLDVHLMIVQPERYVEAFHKAGADILTVHYEACTHLHRTIQQIKAQGMKVGVSLNPHTPVSLLEDVIEDIDVVLLMSVNPGFGGQSFIEQTINKVDKLKRLVMESNSHTLIEIDGGVNFETGKRLVNAGADALVAGSFVFNSPDPEANIKGLKEL